MKSAIITVKTEPALKLSVEEFARGTGMSLSDVVNFSLRQVVSRGRIVIEKPFEPNAKTAKSLRASIKALKTGKGLSPIFHSTSEMDDYLDKL